MRRLVIGALAMSALLLACAPSFGSREEAKVGGGAERGEATAPTGAGAEGGAPDAALERIVTGNTRFALDLYGRIKGDGNLFFSPYSVSTALAMTYAGARGETEREMADVLGFAGAGARGDEPAARAEVARAFAALEDRFAADAETQGYTLHVANALWGDRDFPFLDSYVEFVEHHFDAPLTLVDFVRDAEGTRVRINAWVEERTRGRIKNLIPPGTLTPETLLVLTNAIYFKGKWTEQFSPDSTRDAEFRGLSGATSVPMMNRKGDYAYYENEEAQVVELPYEGGELSMVVMLPKVEGPAGLEALERALTPENVDAWTGSLREREVAVSIPRFEMTWGTKELKDALEALGMRRAFDAQAADFSGMSAAGPLFIGHVLHKAFVEVNEEGTEAAAATAVVMLKATMPTVFRADRPFVFMIRDRGTGSILFLGRVTDLGE